MTLPADRPSAVVLLLAAGLVAALFAVTAFPPQPADAQSPAPLSSIVAEVDGGLVIDEKLTFKVYPPATNRSDYLGKDDEIEVTFPTGPTGFTLPNSVPAANIEFSGSGDPASPSPIEASEVATGSGGILTLTIPSGVDGRVTGNEHLVITIDDSGITAPEIPKGFDGDSSNGYEVKVAFVNTDPNRVKSEADDKNFIVVKNPISSSVPNTAVRIDLFTYTEAVIGPGQEITVDFSGPSADSEFVVPASIATSRITIAPNTGTSFSPSDVLVQGARVILTIPTGTTTARSVGEGEYEIRFSQLARIRNPFAAGNRVIKVWSSVTGEEKKDEITAVIKRTTTIDPQEGPRGTEFELEGKGYARGTVTIYHDADDDKQIDAGETLASVNTVRGTFTVDLTASGKTGKLYYRVRTRDSEGVEEGVEFDIKSGMFFRPVVARVGWPLQITISDWQNLGQGVAAVSVAGETAYVVTVNRYDNCFEYKGMLLANPDRTITLEIDVPPNVPAGEQTVSLYGLGALDPSLTADKESCEGQRGKGALVSSNVEAELREGAEAIIKETIDIDTSELTVTPSTAARGQRVTITGSGFSSSVRGSNHIDSVWIGGKRVDDDHSGFVVGSNGDIAFTVTVPLDVANGPNEVLIEGDDHALGRAVLTVPQATIVLDPSMGQRGTDFTISGSGFIANSVVLITYGAGVGVPQEETQFELALADSRGRFELPFQVPFAAAVGKRHLVKAVGESSNRGVITSVEAEASHLIPWADIVTTPDSVSPGDRLTISGQNLPSFAPVGPITIEGIQVLGKAGAVTDENGSFETDVLVPNLDFGDQTLVVQVAEVVVPLIIAVAPPPLSGTPDQVFKELIRDGSLSSVWSYDNATQSWSVFDPSFSGEMAALNDLAVVDRGDIVWVNLHRPQRFQEAELTAGWNLIALK